MEASAESYNRDKTSENESNTHTYVDVNYVTVDDDVEQRHRKRQDRGSCTFEKCVVKNDDKPQEDPSTRSTPRTSYVSNVTDGHNRDEHSDHEIVDVQSEESVWNDGYVFAEDEGDENKEEVNPLAYDSEESEEEEEIWIETYTVPVSLGSPLLTDNFTYYGQHDHGSRNNIQVRDTFLRTQSDSSVITDTVCSSPTTFSHTPISSRQYQCQDVHANTGSQTSISFERNNTRLDNTQDGSAMHTFANENKNACCQRDTSRSPSRKDAFVKNVSATGASDIQTITKVDSETENVVVLIRPRQRASCPPSEPSTSFDNVPESSLIDSNGNHVSEMQRISSAQAMENEFEIHCNARKDCSRSRTEAVDDANGCEDNVYNNFEQQRPVINVSNNERPVFCFTTDDKVDFVDTVVCQDVNGAKPKIERNRSKSFPDRTSKQKSRYRQRANYNSQRLSPVPETVTDGESTNSDSEDEDIKQLLESMHSNFSSPSGKVKQNMSQGFKTNFNDTDNSIEDISDYSNCDKDRSLSERLKKRRAGGVTVITFLSPSYDKSDIGFTPLKFETTKTVPVKAHDVFMQQATHTQKSLPRDQTTVVKESSRSPIFSSQKLTIPRLHFTDKIIGKEHYIDNSYTNGVDIH